MKFSLNLKSKFQNVHVSVNICHMSLVWGCLKNLCNKLILFLSSRETPCISRKSRFLRTYQTRILPYNHPWNHLTFCIHSWCYQMWNIWIYSQKWNWFTFTFKLHNQDNHKRMKKIKCWNYDNKSKADLTTHTDKYWYCHGKCIAERLKKRIMGEFEHL